MTSLVDHVRSTVASKNYYTAEFPDIHWPASGAEARVNCIFHGDKDTPSLHFNPDTGAWYCHGCKRGGKSILSFHAEVNELGRQEAAEDIFHRFIHPLISELQVSKWHNTLLSTPKLLDYVNRQRLVGVHTINTHQLGFDGYRLTIPVYNEFGLCVNAKMHDPLAKQHATFKMVNYSRKEEPRQYGVPVMIYPFSAFDLARDRGYITVCEGEWDTLLLLSIGIPAVSSTGGSKSWPRQYTEQFRGLRVIVAYDNDAAGTTQDERVIKELHKVAKTIRRLEIPEKVRGHKVKDVTDWAKSWPELRRKESWLLEFKKAPVLVRNKDEVIQAISIQEVSLDQASRADLYHRRIRVPALITGKGAAPYLVPKIYRVGCNKSCESCPLAERKEPYRECQIDPASPETLQLIEITTQALNRELIRRAGFTPEQDCKCRVDVVENANLEQVALIPTIDSRASQYVIRSAYYVGHGLRTNRAYHFEGITTPDPDTQEATHLFDVAKAVQDEIETFRLTDDLKRGLEIFRPRGLRPLAHLMAMADWQSRHITKIRERPDLHVAVDLVFHSVPAFRFNGEDVPRGMLDALIIGDTRCGKGYVTEGLTRYYSLGEVASGENCTFAGLVGGVQQIGKKWMVTWGIIPLNHRRLVVIDEASSLSTDEIGHMSRVRSEGVAEVTKIVRESTKASTRLIWLSNPRSGRPILTYNTGIESVKELVGANEDVSRFDFAMTVATNEVPSEVINAGAEETRLDRDKYPRHLCRALILWAWSRRPEQIQFSPLATDEIIRQAIEFGYTFSPVIPLVQAENIRIKLAKLSAAIAARTFSADPEGELLVVDKQHVLAASQFLRHLYTKPSMGYDNFSNTAIAASTIEGHEPLDRTFENLDKEREPTIAGLLELHRITADTLGDYLGDVPSAKDLIGQLVRLRCLSRSDNGGNYYIKNPDFTTYLREQVNGSPHHDYLPKESNNGNARNRKSQATSAKGRRSRKNPDAPHDA